MHGRDEGELLGFACSQQPVIERAQDGIVAGPDEGGHVEHRAHRRAAAANPAPPAQRAAVDVEGREADQRREAARGQVAQFREQGEQRRTVVWPTPGTLCSKSSCSRHTGERRRKVHRSWLACVTAAPANECAREDWRAAGQARALALGVELSISWRCRTSATRSCVASSRRPAVWAAHGRQTPPRPERRSRRLAKRPNALAKSRTCRGLTTTTASRPWPTRPLPRPDSRPRPPITLNVGVSAAQAATSCAQPRSVFATVTSGWRGTVARTNWCQRRQCQKTYLPYAPPTRRVSHARSACGLACRPVTCRCTRGDDAPAADDRGSDFERAVVAFSTGRTIQDYVWS